MWLTQPDKLETLLAEQSLSDGGLIPRILACHTNCEPREIVEDSPAIPASVSSAYTALIHGLLETYRLASEPRTIDPSPEALQAMNAHHNAIVKRRRGELRDVTSFAARWNEQAWRIAVCLHAAAHGSVAHNHRLEIETAQRAMEIADWFAGQQLEILKAGRMERKRARVEKLRGLIATHYSGKATLRDLNTRNKFTPEEVRELAAAVSGLTGDRAARTNRRAAQRNGEHSETLKNMTHLGFKTFNSCKTMAQDTF